MAESTNYGITLMKGAASIGSIVSLDPPELINEAVESTNHGSGGYKTFLSSELIELSEFSATILMDNVDSALLITDLEAGTAATYTMTFPSGESFGFDALVTKFKPESADATKPEAAKATVTFRPTGTITA